MSLDDLLNRATDKTREDASVEDEEDFDFARHFEDPFMRSKPKTKPKQTEDSELAKIFYRRLMLKIHPDKLSKEFMVVKKPWLDRLWKKIQLAYNDVNVSSLQNLYLQVLISLKPYDEVTYSELKHGSELLKKEFSRIRDSQAGNLSHPAWGFSALKSYKKLEDMGLLVTRLLFERHASGIRWEVLKRPRTGASFNLPVIRGPGFTFEPVAAAIANGIAVLQNRRTPDVFGEMYRSTVEDLKAPIRDRTRSHSRFAAKATIGTVELYYLGCADRTGRKVGGLLIVFREGTYAATNQYVLHHGMWHRSIRSLRPSVVWTGTSRPAQ